VVKIGQMLGSLESPHLSHLFRGSNCLQRGITSFLWLNVFKLSQNINISRPCGSNWTNVGSLERPHFSAYFPRIKLLGPRNHIVPMPRDILNRLKSLKLQYLQTLWFIMYKCWIIRKPSFFRMYSAYQTACNAELHCSYASWYFKPSQIIKITISPDPVVQNVQMLDH
jgi:hypothetical protein